MPARVARIPFICAYPPCQKPFEVLPSQKHRARFCSHTCASRYLASLPRPSTLVERFWPKVAIAGPQDCWLWQAGFYPDGYGKFRANERRASMSAAHVVSWFLTHGFWPEGGMSVCHACDVKACVNPAHLWLGTHTDNMQDMWTKGRAATQVHPELIRHGVRNNQTKITDEQWQEALDLYVHEEWTQKQLAERYGVHRAAIWRRLHLAGIAVRGKTKKITLSQREEIIALYTTGRWDIPRLASTYGVHRTAIYSVLRRVHPSVPSRKL